MQQSFNLFILAFGALQGVLLSILLLHKKVYRTGTVFLLLYLLTMLLQVVLKVASKIWLLHEIPGAYWVSYDLPFLYGPLLYLFIHNKLSPSAQIRVVDTWHFLPFLYFAVGDLLLSVFRNDLIFSLFHVSRVPVVYVQLVSLLVYHVYSFQLLRRRNDTGNQAKVSWLKRHTAASAIVTLSILAGIYLLYVSYPRHMEARLLFAFITIYIYWVSYQVILRPEIFDLSEQAQYKPHHTGSTQAAQINDAITAKKYYNSTLKNEDSDMILTRLNHVMFQQQPYLDTSLGIDALAAMVDTNRHNLSRVINERLHKNFYDYLNAYRVRAAQKMLLDPKYHHLKIAAIAHDAGFNALSTFNDVFKKVTGVKPSDFRKIALNGEQSQDV